MVEIRSYDERAFRAVIPLAAWTVAWVATLALAQFGPVGLWHGDPVASWIAIVANVAAGVAWIVVHARYLAAVDDLQRKILMDALGLALGVGLVVGFAHSVASRHDLVTLEADIGFVSALMGVTYVLVTAIGTLRYR